VEILAAVIIIFATVMHTLIPSDEPPDVQGVRVVYAEETQDSATGSAETDAITDINKTRRDAIDAKNAALDEVRTQRGVAREDVQEARDEFKARLSEIRDARKQLVLKNIADRLDQINERWTTHFSKVLSRLTEILTKIGTRTDKVEESGRDVSSVRLAIGVAEDAISTAQDTVDAQAENSYIIEITDEDGLKSDVKVVRDQLHSDLTSTRNAVKDARGAVHDAFQALKDAKITGDTEGGTDSE